MIVALLKLDIQKTLSKALNYSYIMNDQNCIFIENLSTFQLIQYARKYKKNFVFLTIFALVHQDLYLP
jgi:hypothetical protein